MCRRTILVIFSLVLLNFVLCRTSDSLKVQLHHGGFLIGRHLESAKGRNIRSFLGIPYAKPPVEELRFKSPVSYPGWKGVKLVAKEGPQIDIMQDASIGSEDCLYLNVYTPSLDIINDEGDLPVMVFLHGGGWSTGSGDSTPYGPEYLLEKNIILVTGNYRLGPLGFLSSGTAECPGNFGLKDQLEILNWVRSHIRAFGGNPESVTIFGESAGSKSVSHHLESPKSRGLFHRAIQQSGTIFNPGAYPESKESAAIKALKLAKLVDCDVEGENWPIIIQCLRKVDALEIVKKESEMGKMANKICSAFHPVVEPKHPDAFVDVFPGEAGLNSLDIPVIVGIVADEGLLLSTPILSNQNLLTRFQQNSKDLLPMLLCLDNLSIEQQEQAVVDIEEFYFKDGPTYNLSNHRNFTDMCSDAYAVSGFDKYLEARLSQNSADTYVYVFDHRPPKSITTLMGAGDESLGVCHGDDSTMLFPIGKQLFPTGVYTEKDIMLREAMVDMWVNFATQGNPTPSGSFFKWKSTRKYPWNYAILGSQDLEDWYVLRNEDNYARDRVEFWKNVKGCGV